MKIKLLMIGKTTDSVLNTMIENYISRIVHYVRFEKIVVPELKKTKNMPVELQKIREGELILSKVESTDFLILLDEKGTQFTSVGFSEFLSKRMLHSSQNLLFVIGGPYGFSPAVYNQASFLLSLSSMTFSHQMIRLLFVEQLYRAMSILKGESYHNE